MRGSALGLAYVAGACIGLACAPTACVGLIGLEPPPDSVDAGTPNALDAVASTPLPGCSPGAQFGAPLLVDSLNSAYDDYDARLTPDELTVYFASNRADPSNAFDLRIYVATRARFGDPFGPAQLVEGINPKKLNSFAPSVTEDGLSLYFNTQDPSGGYDIWVSSRARTSDTFSAPTLIPIVSPSGATNGNPMITPDGSSLYFFSDYWSPNRTKELYVSKKVSGSFTVPAALSTLDSAEADNVSIIANQLTIVFGSTRASSDEDIWIARRESLSADWGPAASLAEVNSSALDAPTWLSQDGCRLYMQSARGGNMHLYVATRPLLDGG